MSDYRQYMRTNLRSLRLACGYTQQDVARALGVVRSTYSYYETGKTQPDVETLTRISQMFGVTLDQLVLPGEQPPVSPPRRRAKHRPAADPQTIGDLTEEEKVLIARLRSGELPKKEESP